MRVGAEYCVTSCDLGVFVDEAAEPIPPENAHIRQGCGWIRTSRGWVLVQRPVRPVRVVVIDVLIEDQPQVPFAGDQHPVQALPARARRDGIREEPVTLLLLITCQL